MNDFSHEEAERLFNDVSKAVKDNDVTALDGLYKKDAAEDAPTLEVKDEPKVDDQPVDDDILSEQPDKDKEEKDSPPVEEGNKPTETADKTPKEEAQTPEQKALAELTAQLESMKKENHALRSQAGRVPHVQKRLRELDKKLEELKSASPSSQTSTKIKPKLDAMLKDIEETDSKLADAIRGAITEATNTVDEDARAREIANLEFTRQQEAALYQQHEATRLLDMVPNAKEVFADPNWAAWKKEQSDAVLSLATSGNADDVVKAFKIFAGDMVAKYPHLAATPTADEPDTAAAEKAKKIEEERARKKATAANVASPTAPGKHSMPDDPEALFRKISEQLAKERQR